MRRQGVAASSISLIARPGIVARHLLRGQTNFMKDLWK
jgi:hypothetical protein